jgi:hypothetical protein
MTFTVEGYIDMVSYAVRVGAGQSHLPAYKIAVGSPAALDLLRECDGRPVLVTPTGPTVPGDCATPAGVLAILTTQTQVTRVEPDGPNDSLPNLVGPSRRDVVY